MLFDDQPTNLKLKNTYGGLEANKQIKNLILLYNFQRKLKMNYK